jgi:hypothetical protein
MARAVSHIARADFNLHSVPSATVHDPDAARDDGSQSHLQPLEITGFFGCGFVGDCDPQLFFLVVPVRVALDSQLGGGRVPRHQLYAFASAAEGRSVGSDEDGAEMTRVSSELR